MLLLKEEIYTIDDIYALPEGERAELIDGHMYMMAPPSRRHQKISMELSSVILNIFVFTEESVRYMQLLLLSILMRKVIPMLSRISQ